MSDALSLREFVEKVEKRLAAYSADQLRAIILERAKRTPPSQRWGFLAMWTAGEEPAGDEPDEDLLEEIAELAETVAGGELCTGWGYDHEIGEERDWGDESWKDDVDDFFARAHDALLDGNYALAEKAYAALFEILAMGEDSGYLPGNPNPETMLETDLEEARCSYLRALYFAAPPPERPAGVLEALRKFERLNLQMVIDAGVTPLPDWDRFLPAWIALLEESGPHHLLREAVRLSGGVNALADLARRDGAKHPAAFVDWLAALEEEGDWRAMREAAREGLAVVPPDYAIRARIARGLVKAGERLGLPDEQLTGRREAFYADPNLDRFLDLVTVAEENGCLEEEVEAALARILALLPKRSTSGRWDAETVESTASESLLISAYLVAGRYRQAFELCRDNKEVLGWSHGHNPKGLVVPFFLVLLGGTGANLARLWDEAVEAVGGYFAPGLPDRFRRAMDEVFRRVTLTGGEEQEYLAWCVGEATRRVDAIVGGQHRKSYGKAAVLLAAVAEALTGRRKRSEAAALIDGYHQKYFRHRAFRQELTDATAKMNRR